MGRIMGLDAAVVAAAAAAGTRGSNIRLEVVGTDAGPPKIVSSKTVNLTKLLRDGSWGAAGRGVSTLTFPLITFDTANHL